MRLIRIVAVCLGICLLPALAAGQSINEVKNIFYLGYNPATGQNTLEQNIRYVLPGRDLYGFGPFPLAVWLPGTFASYRDPFSTTMMKQMQFRGFASASVQYNNNNVVQICSEYAVRTESVFDATRALSAISVLCSQSGIDCGKGIVVYGISQGAAMSLMAKNYAPNVKAVYAMSIGDFNTQGGGINLSSCLGDVVTSITSDRVTVVNGESDVFFQGQGPITGVTGLTCAPGSFQCWHPSSTGGGWYIVRDAQVEDLSADHCYILYGNCTTPQRFDVNWLLRPYNWAMGPNLDWLATFGTHRNFSATGQ